MKIGIDCRFASLSVGLGTYTREIVSHLLQRNDPVEYTLFVRSQDEEWLRGISNFKFQISNFPHYSLAEQLRFPKLITSSKIDLLFSPHFNVPYRCPVPFVATVHDLILHRYPNQASLLKSAAYRILMRKTVRSAAHLIAVSNYTAHELCSVYGETVRNRITVIQEGADALFSPDACAGDAEVLASYNLTGGYLLYVGNAKQHKNVQMLLDAHAHTQDAPDLVLVCSGREADALRFGKRVSLLRNVSQEDLPALYRNARCFVTPSLYEGFCLPVAEARAAGCPVLACNRTAIPEVAGEHARLFEPEMMSLCEALRDLPEVSDPLPPQLSWGAAADYTVEVLLRSLHG